MRIRELRQELQYTQEELGKKIGQTKSNISKYETGALEPGIDTLKALSSIFDVSLDYLLEVSDVRNPYCNNSNKPNDLSPESQKELESYREFLRTKDKVDKSKEETSSALENEA